MKHALLKLVDALHGLALAGVWYSRCKYALNPSLRRRNRRLRTLGAPDGLPLPPLGLLFLVMAGCDAEAFYESGRVGAACIQTILEKNGLAITGFRHVLDFGCGCGRIMRHWKSLNGPKLHGVDYNRRMIRWCREALPFATFNVNGLHSGLAYAAETFDFIYAISVFTHLPMDLQDFWIREFSRVLIPRGVLLVTVHGTTRLHELSPEEQAQFGSGELVVRHQKYRGTNVCSVYHPEPHVRQRLANGLALIDFIPGGAKHANQDVVLLRKPPWPSGPTA